MNVHRLSSKRNSGFTLAEMLVAVAVLSLLIVFVAQMVNSAGKVASSSKKHLDSDRQARLVFDRMAADFNRMIKRTDVDSWFYKKTAGNDCMFFYSEGPGDSAAVDANRTTLAAGTAAMYAGNMISLVGYGINTSIDASLERIGKALNWETATTFNNVGSTYNGLLFLTFDKLGSTPPDYTPATATTMATALLNTTGINPNTDPSVLFAENPITGSHRTNVYPTYYQSVYQTVGDQVFRLEYCYLIKELRDVKSTADGITYSVIPTIPAAKTTPTGAVLNTYVYHNPTATRAPTANDDDGTHSAVKYSAGSRWYDTVNGRAYICVNNSGGAAVWNPLGMQDVAAVVVAIGVLDSSSRKMIASKSQWSSLIAALQDPTIDSYGKITDTDSDNSQIMLMNKKWQKVIAASNFYTTAGIPQAAASQVRIYQRTFYLNNPN